MSLPTGVSRSDEMKRSLELWCAYNERLVAEHRRSGFPVLRFDGESSALFEGLQSVARTLRLPAADRSSSFFDAELVHNNDAAEEAIPRSCRALWDYLEAQVLRA